MSKELEEKLNQEVKNLQNAYINTFATLEGKKVMYDLLRNLLIDGEVLARQYTSDDILASHIQVGMKIAYKYIEEQLPISIIKQ
jgi:hypothetical protein